MIKFDLKVGRIESPSIWEESQREDLKQANIICVFFKSFLLASKKSIHSKHIIYNME